MKLNIEKILKVIYFTFENKYIADLITLNGVKSKTTLIDWTNYTREAAHLSVNGEMRGREGKIVQIDESLMRGRRKNNRGRYLLGDILDLDPASNSRRLNCGDRENGPWVFGMAEVNSRKIKLFYVEDRKESTLLPILLKHVHPKTTIWSDEWKAYVNLQNYLEKHETVCHSENFIGPETDTNTQLIECPWSHTKLNIMKNKRGTNITLLQSHLSFFCFQYRYKYEDPFEVFMRTIR